MITAAAFCVVLLNIFIIYSYTETTKNNSEKMLSLGKVRSMMQRSVKLTLADMPDADVRTSVDRIIASYFDPKSGAYFRSAAVAERVTKLSDHWILIKRMIDRYRARRTVEDRYALIMHSEQYTEIADEVFFAIQKNVERQRLMLIYSIVGIIIVGVFMLAIFWYIKTAVRDELERYAFTDALTGALNRRSFEQFLQQTHALYRRTKRRYAVTMMDLDHFKRINDRYGHDIGDVVLKEMTSRIRSVLRGSDIFARIGGEEFVILHPDAQLREVIELGERIMRTINARPFSFKRILVTISLGVTQVRASDTLHRVLKRADHALYRAKRNGRDRLETE